MKQKPLAREHKPDGLSPQARAHALAIARLLLLSAIRGRGKPSRAGTGESGETPDEKGAPPPPSLRRA